MALQKEIELENGIILNYHRIVSLNKITNQHNVIEVNSYINKAQREKEKEYKELQQQLIDLETLPDESYQYIIDIEEREQKRREKINQIRALKKELEKGINVLIEADFIEIPYDENMTIEDAYEYLKTTIKYQDAIDV